MSMSEMPFDVVGTPTSRDSNVVRVTVLAHVLGSEESPAGVEVLLDGRPIGVELFSTGWDPELSLVEDVAADDVSRLTARAIGDAVILKATARPFVADGPDRTRDEPVPRRASGRTRWAGSRQIGDRPRSP